MLLVCYNLLNSQNIAAYQSINNEKWLVTGIPPAWLKKLLNLHRKKSNNWPMVSFIHNGSEITTWIGYMQLANFKTKSTKSQATFLRKRSFRISGCKSLGQHKETKSAIFITTPMKKHIQWFILPKGGLFVNLLAGKLWVQCQSRYLLPACWRYKRGFYFFSLHKIAMSKQHILFIL